MTWFRLHRRLIVRNIVFIASVVVMASLVLGLPAVAMLDPRLFVALASYGGLPIVVSLAGLLVSGALVARTWPKERGLDVPGRAVGGR